MNANPKDGMDDVDLRSSGIPPRGRLGASRNELIALAVGLVLLVAIAVSFWFESR
jgi:hypothetical protein